MASGESNRGYDYSEGDGHMGNSRRNTGTDFFGVDVMNGDLNMHTYVYEPNRSLAGMTIEALPDENHYHDLVNMRKGLQHRPTIEELKSGQLRPAEEADEEIKLKGKIVKFTWVEGVFMRCLLNIWGVMLFLRLTTVIGQCGLVQGLLVICLANVVTAITAISMSAVATNGVIKAGGIYYMISRSLGPEFGGAIGIMFTIANSIAVATYLIGFCTSLLDCIEEYDTSFDGITGSEINDIRIIGTAVLFCILGLAIVGMDWVTRVQILLLVLLIVAQFDVVIGSFMPGEDEKKFGFVGYSSNIISENLLTTNYHDYENPNNEPSFFYWFGVYFPAVTGIVAGANLSGDLRDPSTAIPKGTLLAIAVTFVSYFSYGVITGCVYLSEASGIEAEYWAAINGDNSILHFDDCKHPNRTEHPCIYGSSNDQQTMTKISYTGYLVYAGCFAATLSSAIASLVGAPRVLQALAKDKLYPFIHIFAKGHGANNDPFRGYILVFFISLGCTMIGNLDVVGTLLSNFFVAAYALINLSVFHASMTKSPGWRPTFKYYNKWMSLLGCLLCIVVMFLIDWVTALITVVCICVLYIYIYYTKPETNWGSSTQALQFVSTLKSLQNLQENLQDHVKNYRPKVLVLSGIPAHRVPLVDFADLITKDLSLLIFGHVAKELPVPYFSNLKSNVNMWLKDHKIKGFFSVTSANNFEEGAMSHMNLAGLGRFDPNMVLMGYKSDWQKDPGEAEQYYNVINHAFDLHLAVAILRLKGNCDYSSVIATEETILTQFATTINEKEAEKHETVVIAEEVDPDPKKKGKKAKKEKKPPKPNKKVKNATSVLYQGADGRPLPKITIEEITQFKGHKEPRQGNVDIWWLYDDGGLTLLLPYILRTRKQFANCHFRVFALANKKEELDRETRNMIALLAKFRVKFSDVTVIPDVTKKAKAETKAEFKELLHRSGGTVSEAELLAQKEKTNRHLRLAELLRHNSTGAEMVIMTLPIPRKSVISPALYLGWLEIMTREMPPFLLVRGNQTSVLTFYS